MGDPRRPRPRPRVLQPSVVDAWVSTVLRQPEGTVLPIVIRQKLLGRPANFGRRSTPMTLRHATRLVPPKVLENHLPSAPSGPKSQDHHRSTSETRLPCLVLRCLGLVRVGARLLSLRLLLKPTKVVVCCLRTFGQWVIYLSYQIPMPARVGVGNVRLVRVGESSPSPTKDRSPTPLSCCSMVPVF